MTNQQERRERIAAQVLSGLAACGSDCTLAGEVQLAVRIADDLIAELDRTAPSNPPVVPEGWVLWDDGGSNYPICDATWQWLRPVVPWTSYADALSAAGEVGCRVRKWPLDSSEDKEAQS